MLLAPPRTEKEKPAKTPPLAFEFVLSLSNTERENRTIPRIHGSFTHSIYIFNPTNRPP